jgi:hypothetical protein
VTGTPREGVVLLSLTALTAAAILAGAVWRRSWATWLVGFGFLVLALVVAWSYRTASGPGPVAVRLEVSR